MANTKKYLSHLLQNTGITPACSEEERAAADVIAKVFSEHGFAPEVQEFTASGSAKVVQAVLGILVFAGAVLSGVSGAVGVVGLLIALAAAVLFVMERSGRPVLSNFGAGGLSQNVIAYHRATGPLASPRNRPVVVVAHYDSPRADLLSSEPFAACRPLVVKLLPVCMIAPVVLAVARMLPVPDPAKIVLWVLAIISALVPLVNGIAIIANRFFLPYTTGSVCNKSSVAAMLGVMDAVAPYEMGEEFPADQPADEYFAEQQRILDEAIAAAEAAAAAEVSYPHEMEDTEDEVVILSADEESESEPMAEVVDLGSTSAMGVEQLAADMTAVNLPVVDAAEEGESAPLGSDNCSNDAAFDEQGTIVFNAVESDCTEVVSEESLLEDASEEDVPIEMEGSSEERAAEEVEVIAEEVQPEIDFESAEPESPFHANADGNLRFGADVIRSLGMMPETCEFVYERESSPASAVAPATFVDEASTREDDVVTFDDSRAANEEFAPEFDECPVAPVEATEEVVSEAVEEAASGSDMVFDEEFVESEYIEDGAAFENAFSPMQEVQVDDYILEAEYEVIEEDEEEPVEMASVDSDGVAEGESTSVSPDVADEPADATAAESDDGGESSDVDVDEDVPEGAVLVEDAAFESSAPNGVSQDEPVDDGATQMFTISAEEPAADLSGTVAMPVQRVDTVDSLMAEIDRAVPARPRRVINVPSTAAAPQSRAPETANRASLFDLPDPSAAPVDPFSVPSVAPVAAVPAVSAPAVPASVLDEQAAEARSAFTVISSPAPIGLDCAPEAAFETISAPTPEQEKPRRGLGRLFGRKKKNEDSMSDWLGVDDSFDAERSGHDIGSWDNFDDDDWKGGAAPFDGASEEELREAIADMGDDELLGHDIWFVATGASENGNAGMQAFLDAHRDKLRGVFLINLESVGAGQVAMLSTEGERRVLKGDKRITKLVQHVSSDFHHEYPTVDMPYVTTDANVAMNMSLRSLTIAGVEGAGFALARTEEDQPYNVDLENVAVVSDVVTEVIRRS